MQPVIIGLAGLRQVGKSHIADHLIARHGFRKIHPFSGGKAACRAYFQHVGVSAEDAIRMTDGDLKDKPCEKLPEGVPARFFMERFGKFMGVEMGPDWTIGQEIRLDRERGNGDRVLIESLVYEDMVVRAGGGLIWRVWRPGVNPTPGFETDAYTMRMSVDLDFINDKPTLEELYLDVDALVEQQLARQPVEALEI